MNTTKMTDKQTAVEWLQEKLNKILIDNQIQQTEHLFKQAKKMEWELMENVWHDSRIEDFGDEYIGKQTSFNDYYNKTFNTKEK